MDVVVETVSVEVLEPPEERVTLVGLREAVGPVGETDLDRETVPPKPAMLVRVMAEVPADPA